MMKKKKSLIIPLFIVLLGVGFALLQASFQLNGTTSVQGNEWGVKWDHIMITPGSVTGTQVLAAPTISNDDTSISFDIHLKKPGEFFEFTVDARNDGSIDAILFSIQKSVNNSADIPYYLTYTVTYHDDIPVAEQHLLPANTIETYKVRVEFKQPTTMDDMLGNATTLSLSLEATYVQADKDIQIEIPNRVYEVSSTTLSPGDSIPNAMTTYDDYQSAITAYGRPTFLKLIVDNGVIDRGYIGFMRNNKIYYLPHSIDYERDKNILMSAFGVENCEEDEDPENHTPRYICLDCSTNLGAILQNNYKAVGVRINDTVADGCGYNDSNHSLNCNQVAMFSDKEYCGE